MRNEQPHYSGDPVPLKSIEGEVKGHSVRPLVHRVEWGVALAVSATVIGLHVLHIFYAGGLWRDEVLSASVASMPSWSEILGALHFDTVLGLLPVLLHIWMTLFGEADLSLRIFAAVVGIAVIGALWLNAHLLGHKIPWLSILLLGFSPLVIQHGDSIRGYGLGMLTTVVTFGLVWKVTQTPTRAWIIAAMLSSLLAVHALYPNSFFLLAAGLSGMAICARKGQWRRVGLLAAIGMIAAFSLLPYSSVAAKMREVQDSYFGVYHLTLLQIWNVLSEALGRGMRWVWVSLVLFGVVIALDHVFVRFRNITARQRDVVLYSVTAMIIGTLGFLVFLKVVRFPTYPRNYLPIMAFIAICLGPIFELLVRTTLHRVIRLSLVAVITMAMVWPAWQGAHVRQTTIDLIASDLEKTTAKDDLIIVYPWYTGGVFKRYYRGETPWTTIPPLEQIELQPITELRQHMMAAHPIQPIIDQIARTMQSGHRLWLVGGPPFPEDRQVPPELPPAPHAQWGWSAPYYTYGWGLQAGHFIQTHADRGTLLPPTFEGPVNPYENPRVIVVEGWH